ncbi:ATP-binding protein [Maribacter sp. SA7]|nr:ATP-binding protein [Maribacter zhoushanensis]MDF4204352.1 ATP-binding protein [Maribacter zhoushanensis]
MTKIAFKVSARAGKLLGRENFSNPEGAIIELVKNSYDADAKNCLVLFDIPTKKVKDDDGKEIEIPVREKSIL